MMGAAIASTRQELIAQIARDKRLIRFPLILQKISLRVGVRPKSGHSRSYLRSNTRRLTPPLAKGYFARVRYLEWSDIAPPLIRISPDGQMGWMAANVRARYIERAKPEAGEKAFKSSWIATYQRQGCEWKMTGNSSAVVDE
jgi:hypothetical protein